MTPITIRHCAASELLDAPNRYELWDEYALESSINGLPHPNVQIDMYRMLEQQGVIQLIGAFDDTKLIGFVAVLANVLPHYGVIMAITESFFVSKDYRKTGAGLKLLREAERHARSIKAPGLLVSAPFGGRLAEVLPHVGYDETNRVFFKKLDHE
ncbi:acetyltransferase domain containing protein [uncultured Caudovirales phage]|uniref:Acetyltransferase domain containing protein n=1 Tax=uncultured Caudovirales phage TaxID=2100421 RepID=A0A6J7W865_9CAUD|nr:acetyltransferase domain containing protein [uncultured Caudovirales phage]